MEIVSYCTKSGRMSRKLVSGKYLSITKQCLTTLMTFKILDIACDMSRRTFLVCTWICMGLDGSTCSECLTVVTYDFEPPEHVPRTSARAHACAVVFGRAPCVPRSREHEKRPTAGREKNADVQKNTCIHRNIDQSGDRFIYVMRMLRSVARSSSSSSIDSKRCRNITFIHYKLP